MNLNKVILIGRTTRKPELRQTPNGTKVCRFSLATNNVYMDAQHQKHEETDFHDIVAFGKTGETIATYVEQGQIICVEGRLKKSSWKRKDNSMAYQVDIIAEKFQFGPKAKNSQAAAPAQQAQQPDPGISLDEEVRPEDLPF
jgi:single-strand DNA-binding protein